MRPRRADNAPLMAEALLCTCIDFRFLGLYPRLMEQLGLTGQHDQISLAGASLVLSGIPNENQRITLLEQIKAAKALHQVQRVILVDHEDCGAYGLFLGTHPKDPSTEREIHSTYLKKAKAFLQGIDPTLSVELYYVTRAGQFEQIA